MPQSILQLDPDQLPHIILDAGSLDHAAVSEPVQVAAAVDFSNQCIVATTIVDVADVHRHVHVLDAMDQEA
jgi:hypothetical protein